MHLPRAFTAIVLTAAAVATLPRLAPAEDVVYSGPQMGEKLPEFSFRQSLGEHAGQELNIVKLAAGRPIVLIFVHDINRQSISFTRVLSQFTHSRRDGGLTTGIIFLNADATEAENSIKRMQHALTPDVPTGVSLDGGEGPGSYGLNRRVMLTILVADQDKVTANFAMIQPSLQVDMPQVLASIVEVAGGEIPKLEDLDGMQASMRREPPATAKNTSAPNMRPLLIPLIRKTASQEEVAQAATAIENAIVKDSEMHKELGRIASTIVNSGKLKNYGNEHAQKYLAKWAKELGEPVGTNPAEQEQPVQSGDSQ